MQQTIKRQFWLAILAILYLCPLALIPAPFSAQCLYTKKTEQNNALVIILICYLTGRQVRSACIVPTEDESITGILRDIAVGYATNSFITICHEAGHAIICRLCLGVWPDNISLGSSCHDGPVLLSFFDGKICLRGLNPLEGITTFPKNAAPFTRPRALPVFAAGSIFGIASYYGLKKLISNLYKQPEPIYHDDFERIFFAILDTCQVSVIFELGNLITAYDTPGTDAYNIATTLGHLSIW